MFSVFLDKGYFYLLEDVLEKRVFYPDDKDEMIRFLKSFELGLRPRNPYVFQFFYESGFVFQNLDLEIELDKKKPLLLFIEYKKITKLNSLPCYEGTLDLSSVEDDYRYDQKFSEGYEELLKGECYQFNLTIENKHSFKQKEIDPIELMGLVWKNPNKRGAFAHGTYDSDNELIYLSNSPECLYSIKRKNEISYIVSMPIKGSVSLRNKTEADIPSLWKQLVRDKKNQGELFMISDLIRNDLSTIDLPMAKVIKRKAPLIVPGILHQFSIIECPLKNEINLYKVLSALIPGGSITGAPKKNVMRILNRLEGYRRGFYCGSTVLWHKDVHSASINIRSSTWDLKNGVVSIPAGGGITLKSSAADEYQELQDKLLSFKNLLY